ncbi:MAG: DUF4974 domain-containing protein [Saprospiraceae bacterium]|nr:DUF4974 domain-containing protein [Saprospiraceae bacterium]
MRQNKDVIILGPVKQAPTIKKNAQLVKQSTQDPNYLSWKSDHLIFNETNLEEVVFALNRHFQAKVILGDPALALCKLTATYDRQSLQAVIRILEKTLNIKAEEREGKIFSGVVAAMIRYDAIVNSITKRLLKHGLMPKSYIIVSER